LNPKINVLSVLWFAWSRLIFFASLEDAAMSETQKLKYENARPVSRAGVLCGSIAAL
jgi:hypothetical protein